MKAALVLMFAVAAVAQPPARAPETPRQSSGNQPTKIPEIPAPLVTKVFKAQSEMLAAQATAREAADRVQEKTQAMQRILAELQQACGEKFEPQLSSAGDPVCVAKTAAAKGK